MSIVMEALTLSNGRGVTFQFQPYLPTCPLAAFWGHVELTSNWKFIEYEIAMVLFL